MERNRNSLDFDLNLDNNDFISCVPQQSHWFHGRLDRRSAETRLQSSQLMNCYLIRESD